MNIIDGKTYAAMVENGFKNLKEHYLEVNELNVFPVPDGDTGTNMTATVKGGVESMKKVSSDHLGEVAVALANGMLLSARGNSGVILSQFFAGIADGLKGKANANVIEFADVLELGTKTAYKAVKQPVEGTILTVAREGTSTVKARAANDELVDFEHLFKVLLVSMKEALQRTPELLAVLKEAGVIDSGGAGLIFIMEGMGKEILGEEVVESVSFVSPNAQSIELGAFNEDSELTYGYCTEFILQLLNSKDGPKNFSLNAMIDEFSKLGDSIVAIQNGTIVKVHVHTKTPSLAIEYAQRFGEFLTFKMENMTLQHNETLMKEIEKEQTKKKKDKFGIVAVAPSKEIADLFTQMGVKEIVSGGQSMNPSSQDFLDAFNRVNARTILVFPNNGNVILTAEQAGKLYDKAKVVVIHSKSVIDAYSAIPMLDLESGTLEENLQTIREAIENLVSGEISVAIRDSVNNGIPVKEGDAIGILSGAVVSDDPSMVNCFAKLLKAVPDIEDRSVITLFYGEGANEEFRQGVRKVVSEYEDLELEEIEGGQKVYPLIVALE